MRWRRVWGMVLRNVYLYRRSLPRLMEIVFWPTMDLLVWGFLSVYIMKTGAQIPIIAQMLIGGTILWDLFYRSQQGITISFLEDIWSRNLINVFATPMTLADLMVGTGLISVCKAVATAGVLAVLAWLIYDFTIWTLGPTLLLALVDLLLLGWALGISTAGLILRFGHAAEALAWGIPYLVQPLSAVFYPVSVLPGWVQPLAWVLPSTHVFEGLRSYVQTGQVPVAAMVLSFLLDLVYIGLAVLFFRRIFETARERGLVAKLGME